MKEAERQAEVRRLWHACLDELVSAAPKLRNNPWLFIQNADFVHSYLDSLTEVLTRFREHKDDFERIGAALREVYATFLDLGRFARVQPCFYLTNPRTIERCVQLLGQVAHKGSEQSLFPNVLSMLLPTVERPHLHALLANANILTPLLAWVADDWIPTPETVQIVWSMLKHLSGTPTLQSQMLSDHSFLKLLVTLHEPVKPDPYPIPAKQERLYAHQIAAGKAALSIFPPPKFQDVDDADRDVVTGAGAGAAGGGGGDPSMGLGPAMSTSTSSSLSTASSGTGGPGK